MRLSVIIPVHNAEEYLGECLDSVLGQRDDRKTGGSPSGLR